MADRGNAVRHVAQPGVPAGAYLHSPLVFTFEEYKYVSMCLLIVFVGQAISGAVVQVILEMVVLALESDLIVIAWFIIIMTEVVACGFAYVGYMLLSKAQDPTCPASEQEQVVVIFSVIVGVVTGVVFGSPAVVLAEWSDGRTIGQIGIRFLPSLVALMALLVECDINIADNNLFIMEVVVLISMMIAGGVGYVFHVGSLFNVTLLTIGAGIVIDIFRITWVYDRGLNDLVKVEQLKSILILSFAAAVGQFLVQVASG